MPLKRPRVLSADPGPGATIDSNDRASLYPSSRGVSGGSAASHRIDNPDRRTGMPPLKKTSGGPSSSPDVNASELMQNKVMNDDDKEWYEKFFKKMHKNFLKPRFTVNHGFDVGLNASYVRQGKALSEKNMKNSTCLGCSIDLCRKHLQEGKKKKLIIEPDDVDKRKKRSKKKEVNAVAAGGISGYTLPLGMSNQTLKARRKNAKVNARAFGGGKVRGKF